MARRKLKLTYDRARVHLSSTWPDFTDEQLEELLGQGVLDEQIVGLRLSLHMVRIEIEHATPIGPVRARVGKLVTTLRKASRLLQELIEPLEILNARQHRAKPDVLEAAARILNSTDNYDVLFDASDALDAALTAAETARKQMPVQRRYRVSWRAVQRISRALLDGFGMHYWDAEGHLRTGNQPPYEFAPSREGPFAEIVRICWEAVGVTTGPDRAIREYLAGDKQVTLAGRKRAGFPAAYLQGRKRGRPKGVGNRATARRKS